MQPQISPYPVSDFLQWNGSNQLVITPKFQRRDVWNPKAKSYLIDTILRQMPIPPIFLRLKTQTNPPKTFREVVDGQQRIRCVLSFIEGVFPILPVHNADYGGKYFDDLPDDAKQNMLSYKFQVNTLEDISDAEVLRIFARLNTYTERLTPQELLNAEFFGAFKNTVYDIALRYYTFWTSRRIFTDAKIARMAEAEFTSELIIGMIAGIQQTNPAQIKTFYAKYDDEFPSATEVSERFDRVISIIGDAFGDELTRSPFRRQPLFYSVFLAVYDRQFGLPTAEREARDQVPSIRRRQHPVRPAVLGRNLRALQAEMRAPAPGTQLARFVEDSSRATANPGKRRSRHNFLMKLLFIEQ